MKFSMLLLVSLCLSTAHGQAAGGPPAPAPGPAPGPQFPCPGTHKACEGRGECETSTRTCWCDVGFGGPDCGTETPLFVQITAVTLPHLQDMVGLYRADGMYVMEGLKDSAPRFVYYDGASKGWAVSKFNSTCTDDICLFGYSPGRELMAPPAKGYTFGGDLMHVYYKQLMFDAADLDPRINRGYFETISYAHDPQIAGTTPDLSEFNGRYRLQPRYTHIDGGKYAIFPMDLENSGKKWIAAGLVGMPRKWTPIAEAYDHLDRRYFAPLYNWDPPVFAIQYACANHVQDVTCTQMMGVCHTNTPDSLWVRECCRSTCMTCELSRFACKLPKSNPILALAMTSKSARVRESARKRFRGTLPKSPGLPMTPAHAEVTPHSAI